MRARGLFVCLGAGRMRWLRVRFYPDCRTFQEPTRRDSREPSWWWVRELRTDATRHARTLLRAGRACANERRQRVRPLRSRAGRRRLQADRQRPDRVLARQPQGGVRRCTPGNGVRRRERRVPLREQRTRIIRRQATPHPPSSEDRKSTRLNSSHANISYAVFCLKKKKK